MKCHGSRFGIVPVILHDISGPDRSYQIALFSWTCYSVTWSSLEPLHGNIVVRMGAFVILIICLFPVLTTWAQLCPTFSDSFECLTKIWSWMPPRPSFQLLSYCEVTVEQELTLRTMGPRRRLEPTSARAPDSVASPSCPLISGCFQVSGRQRQPHFSTVQLNSGDRCSTSLRLSSL